ncbi:hypothetical protein BASA61_002707 [Batrachochytrium salamandrivorans]|nr:hypothetical protein BASA61_002707 [Batrachochytrium salamandrivorans]
MISIKSAIAALFIVSSIPLTTADLLRRNDGEEPDSKNVPSNTSELQGPGTNTFEAGQACDTNKDCRVKLSCGRSSKQSQSAKGVCVSAGQPVLNEGEACGGKKEKDGVCSADSECLAPPGSKTGDKECRSTKPFTISASPETATKSYSPKSTYKPKSKVDPPKPPSTKGGYEATPEPKHENLVSSAPGAGYSPSGIIVTAVFMAMTAIML